jgi:excinuclease UvrABC ATPase subunit
MAKYTIDEETLVSLANSIRNKTNSTNLLTPLEMITDVTAISGNGNSNLGEEVIFDDRNNDVKNYLNASSVYSESNRATVSVIGNYANTNILD